MCGRVRIGLGFCMFCGSQQMMQVRWLEKRCCELVLELVTACSNVPLVSNTLLNASKYCWSQNVGDPTTHFAIKNRRVPENGCHTTRRPDSKWPVFSLAYSVTSVEYLARGRALTHDQLDLRGSFASWCVPLDYDNKLNCSTINTCVNCWWFLSTMFSGSLPKSVEAVDVKLAQHWRRSTCSVPSSDLMSLSTP